jgi:hypothetical protein
MLRPQGKNKVPFSGCSLLAESICANFMHKLRQKPKSISIPFFEKILHNFQDCKFFTIELHLKLITKLTVILTSCIKTALSYFHTLEKTAFMPSFSIYHDKIDMRVLILLCARLRSLRQ